MKALELSHRLTAPPIFYLIAKNLERDEINIYGLSTRLKNIEYWIEEAKEMSRQGLGNDYVFCEERNMEVVRKHIAEFTSDAIFQKLLECLHLGLWDNVLCYVEKIKEKV